ncbi:MAG: glycosyltransferase family 2 protein [Anaerolineales bacterium]|nr:glycosyltransferase family 2 protein [Anaerolineales bacterium]
MLDLATIIVSYNTRDLLAQALRALHSAVGRSGLATRTLVVDNASNDGSAEMVRRLFPWVTLLEPRENLGFAKANNLAMRQLAFDAGQQGEARAVWLLNPDTEVVGEAPAQLLTHLDANPRVGAVGPSLRYGDGGFQHGAFAAPGLAQLIFELFPVPARFHNGRMNGRYSPQMWRGPAPFQVDTLLGAAMMVRGATIAQIGLMDERYFIYMEEMDWCRQIRRGGWQIHALPTATVIHHSGQSTQQFRYPMFVALWRARMYYYRKWDSPRYVAMVRRLVKAGMVLRLAAVKSDDPDAERRRTAYREVAAL